MRTTTKEQPATRTTVVVVGDSYTADLKQRLVQYQITQGALAREAGIDEGQVSRWFTTGMEPRWPSIARLEHAITRILVRRQQGPRPSRQK